MKDNLDVFVHKRNGELELQDPNRYFKVPGTKVRMIDSRKAKDVGCSIVDGAIGVITPETIKQTGFSAISSIVYVQWSSHDLREDTGEIAKRRFGNSDTGPTWWCDPSCLEVVSTGN